MAKVNIENLYLTILVQPKTTKVSAQVDVSDDEFEGYPTEAVDAEEALFDGPYWDDMVHSVEDEFEKAEEAREPASVGDLVAFDDPEEEEMDGLIGRVIHKGPYGITVEFFNWNDGHHGGLEDGSESRWFCAPERLTVLK
jgi:hypothetical protein